VTEPAVPPRAVALLDFLQIGQRQEAASMGLPGRQQRIQLRLRGAGQPGLNREPPNQQVAFRGAHLLPIAEHGVQQQTLEAASRRLPDFMTA